MANAPHFPDSFADSGQAEMEASSSWLPALITRPVLPLEEFTFKATHPHAVAAVRLCGIHGVPLAAMAAMPAPEHGADEMFGTSLRIDDITELDDNSLQVVATGLHAFRLLAERVQPYRLDENTVAMTKMVRVTWLLDAAAKPSDTALESTRIRVMNLLRVLRPVSAGSWGTPPQDATEFSWWAAARLPLPPTARGLLLRVVSSNQRLETCDEVLTAATQASEPLPDADGGSQPLRSRL